MINCCVCVCVSLTGLFECDPVVLIRGQFSFFCWISVDRILTQTHTHTHHQQLPLQHTANTEREIITTNKHVRITGPDTWPSRLSVSSSGFEMNCTHLFFHHPPLRLSFCSSHNDSEIHDYLLPVLFLLTKTQASLRYKLRRWILKMLHWHLLNWLKLKLKFIKVYIKLYKWQTHIMKIINIYSA